MENKFFIDGNKNLTKKQLIRAKANSFYLFNAFAAMRTSIREGKKRIGGELRFALLSGKLQFDDNVTGIDTNKLAEKIKFLTMSISDQKHPENLKKFKDSFFYSVFLKRLLTGKDFDNNLKNWPKFKNISTDEKYKDKTAIAFSFDLVQEDLNLPLGLDFSKIIDTIVQTDKDGNYYLEDTCSAEDEIAISEALNYQLSLLQNHPKFKENFEYTEKEDEIDDENDDDYYLE